MTISVIIWLCVLVWCGYATFENAVSWRPFQPDPQTQLNEGILAGDLDSVTAALRRGADPNGDCLPRSSALLEAVMKSNAGVVSKLLSAGARPNNMPFFGETALTAASLNKNGAEMVSSLLKAGADPNLAKTDRRNAMYNACGNTDLRVAIMLIDQGADTRLRGPFSRTPLMQAVENESATPQFVRLLVTAGAEIDAVDEYGVSAIDYAKRIGRHDLAAILREARSSKLAYGSGERRHGENDSGENR